MITVPPLPDAPGVALVKMFGQIGDHTCEQVVHWKFSGTATDADMVEIATQWQTAWENEWMNFGTEYVSTDVSLLYTTATDLTTPTSAFGQYTHSQAGNSDERCSANDAILLSHNVGMRYRGGHPRTYVFGATNDNVADGSQTWIDGAVAQALAAWEYAVTGVLDGTYPVITDLAVGALSYFTGGALRVSPVFLPFVDTVVSNIIRSQRRRVRRTPTPT